MMGRKSYDSRRTHNTNSQNKFKTTMLRSSLSDYNDAYILFKGTIKATGIGDAGAERKADERN